MQVTLSPGWSQQAQHRAYLFAMPNSCAWGHNCSAQLHAAEQHQTDRGCLMGGVFLLLLQVGTSKATQTELLTTSHENMFFSRTGLLLYCHNVSVTLPLTTALFNFQPHSQPRINEYAAGILCIHSACLHWVMPSALADF